MNDLLGWAIVLAATLGVGGCKPKSDGGSSAPKAVLRRPHKPVNGPAMWTVQLEEGTLQDLDENDQPVGQPKPISVQMNGVEKCRLEKDPGNEPIPTWFAMHRDESGGMTLGEDPSVAEEITYCAKSAMINLKDVRAHKQSYRATVRVYFSDPEF